MELICVECKNKVDISSLPLVQLEQVVECNHCGISLLVIAIEGNSVVTEILDEGK
ncbi:MAG: hypothetical protein KBD15_04130 [Candidatus Magasanikbacteria bacterium]|jgi:DNA-directed RNA polymerase subunit RPC12/RpoP|nr:hypothetical protein [Candidatus Magasanikbacteria bacterium]